MFNNPGPLYPITCTQCHIVIFQREGFHIDYCHDCNKAADEEWKVKELANYSKIDQAIDAAWEINR